MKFTVKDANSKQMIKDYIDSLADDKSYKVTISLHRQQRSVSQNNLYWLWISIIADETGNDKESLHQLFMQKFIGWNTQSLHGSDIHTLPSTTKLSTAQFTTYLEQIDAWTATELGIILPHPEDKYWEEYINSYNKL